MRALLILLVVIGCTGCAGAEAVVSFAAGVSPKCSPLDDSFWCRLK